MVKGSKVSALPILILDIFLVNVSYSLSFLINNYTISKIHLELYLSLILWISILTGFIFLIFDLHSNCIRGSIHVLVFNIFLSTFIVSLLTMAVTFLERGFAFPRSVILIGTGLQVVFITLSHSIVWYLNRRLFGSQRVLIITQDSKEGAVLEEKLMQQKEWFKVNGFISVDNLSELESKIKGINVVLISPKIPQKSFIINLCVKYSKEVLIVPEVHELYLLRSEPQKIDDLLVLSIRPHKLTPRQLFFKRLIDITLSMILLTIFSPIIVFLFIAIPLLTKGPALFKQERLGKNREKFQILKFRSMITNAEKISGPVLATDKDPRITKIGKFIRATRLDELPQLINVLIGHMSLVGPRPERLFFVHQFEETIQHYSYRMSIKPGLTGLAQVMGNYSTTVEDKLRLDMMYILSYSFVLDLKILCKTIKVVLNREQAGGV